MIKDLVGLQMNLKILNNETMKDKIQSHIENLKYEHDLIILELENNPKANKKLLNHQIVVNGNTITLLEEVIQKLNKSTQSYWDR